MAGLLLPGCPGRGPGPLVADPSEEVPAEEPGPIVRITEHLRPKQNPRIQYPVRIQRPFHAFQHVTEQCGALIHPALGVHAADRVVMGDRAAGVDDRGRRLVLHLAPDLRLAAERRERGNALFRGLAFAEVACARERVRRWRKGAFETRPRRVP